jgi:hypothetical protein
MQLQSVAAIGHEESPSSQQRFRKGSALRDVSTRTTDDGHQKASTQDSRTVLSRNPTRPPSDWRCTDTRALKRALVEEQLNESAHLSNIGYSSIGYRHRLSQRRGRGWSHSADGYHVNRSIYRLSSRTGQNQSSQ